MNKFDASGNKSAFAVMYGYQFQGIAIQIPEPATLLLFALGGLALRRKR
jgi:hypothetical protein